MIEQFFRPESVQQALELKRQFLDEAVYVGGGSKLNAAPTRTSKRVGISLARLGLSDVNWLDGQLHIGATVTLQSLIDTPLIPQALRDALGFVYSRHVRNQATLGGEVAAQQQESVLLPVLLALDASVVTAGGNTIGIEDYLSSPRHELLLKVVLPDPYRRCATRKVARSAAGLAVLTAAVSLSDTAGVRVALDGVAQGTIRLRDAEKSGLENSALEQVVSASVAPQDDIRGSAVYKRYITGVVVADLLADCRQMQEGQ